MSGALSEVVITVIVAIFAFFVPLGRQSPASKFARFMFVATPLALLGVSQYLWATTGFGLIERGTCLVAPNTKSCLSPENKKMAVFNQICPAALSLGQGFNWVPYVASLTTLNPEPRGDRRYTCRAEGRGITYLITVHVLCDDLADYGCTRLTKVENGSGALIWEGYLPVG